MVPSTEEVSYTKRLIGFDKPTVWAEFTPLAAAHKACNLGQGYPDWDCPQFAKDAIIKSVTENNNQYCRSAGEIHLVHTLATHYTGLLNRTIDPLANIAVCVGATECLFAIMQSYIQADDEVLMLEPAFDVYTAQVQMAGGKSVLVPLMPPVHHGLESPEWTLDFVALEAAITPRTKLLLINTPHNPTGKVFSHDELKLFADILIRHPHVTAVCDEVYEYLVFSPKGHGRLAALPGMWDRVITVSSAGKTFSITGWKVGWAVGPKELIHPITIVNQWVQFSVSTPAQKAISDMINTAKLPYEGYPSYFHYLLKMYEKKMDFLIDCTREAGLIPLRPEGSFFLMCDTSRIQMPAEYEQLCDPVYVAAHGGEVLTRDWAFCRWLTKDIGVAAIPASAFYLPERKYLASDLIRLCFCKVDETLEEAGKRLLKLKPYLRENSNGSV